MKEARHVAVRARPDALVASRGEANAHADHADVDDVLRVKTQADLNIGDR
jgi:hypothetical protein